MSTSEQARQDAMADAETLRLFTVYSMQGGYGNTDRAFKLAVNVLDAGRVRTVRERARAAFRAVPGLRG